MYRINTGEARTDLYGIGKGNAQIIDLSPTRRANEIAQANERTDKKQAEAEQKGLIADISKLGKGAIRPSDMGYFMESQKALYDDVKKAYLESKGRDLSIEKQVEFESRIAGLNTEAAASAARSKVNTDNATEALKNQGKFRKDSLDAIYKDQFDASSARNWGTNTPGLKGDLNLIQDAQKLMPLIKEAVATQTIERPMGDGSTRKQIFTGTNYKDVVDPKTGEIIQPGIETFLRENLKNEEVFDKAQYELNQIPVDVAIKKYGVGADGKPDVANYYIETLKPFFKQSNDSDIRTAPSVSEMIYNDQNKAHVEVVEVEGAPIAGGKNTPKIATTIRIGDKPLSFIQGDGSTVSLGTAYTEKGDENDYFATGTRTLNKQEEAQNKEMVRQNNIRESNIEQEQKRLDAGVISQAKFDKTVRDNSPKELPYPNPSISVILDKSKVDKIIEFNQKDEKNKKSIQQINNGDVPAKFTYHGKGGYKVDNKNSKISGSKGDGAKYNIKGRKYSEKELTNMGYTLDNIAQYKVK